jgi:hypothetical protein
MASDGLRNALRRFQLRVDALHIEIAAREPVWGGDGPPGVAASSVRAARVPILPRVATMVEPSCFIAISVLWAWPSARRALAAATKGKRTDAQMTRPSIEADQLPR